MHVTTVRIGKIATTFVFLFTGAVRHVENAPCGGVNIYLIISHVYVFVVKFAEKSYSLFVRL
jgi:cell division ATPase FtsA